MQKSNVKSSKNKKKLSKHTLHEYCAFEQTIPAFLSLDLSSPAKGTSVITHLYDLNNIQDKKEINYFKSICIRNDKKDCSETILLTFKSQKEKYLATSSGQASIRMKSLSK